MRRHSRSRLLRATLCAGCASLIFAGCYYDKFTKVDDNGDEGDGGSTSSGGMTSGDGGSTMGGGGLGGTIISDVAVANLDQRVIEQGASLVLDLLGNDSGPGIRFVSVDDADPNRPAPLDALELSVSSRGVLTFEPAEEFWGTYEASYTIEDENGEEATADVLIHVIPKDISLATIEDGWGGFLVDGEAGDFLGTSVAAAGDVNGDGIADFLVGAPGAPGASVGRVALILGSSALADVQLGQAGAGDFVQILKGAGVQHRYRLGAAVSRAGRVNEDSLDDVILGTSRSSDDGAAYILYGRESYPGAPITVSDDPDDTLGYTITGSAFRTGAAVSGGYDMNNDGSDDVLAYAADSGQISVDFDTTNGMASAEADLEFTSAANAPSVMMVGDLFGKDGRSEVIAAGNANIFLIRGAAMWPGDAGDIDNMSPEVGWKLTFTPSVNISQVAGIGTFDGNATRDIAYCLPTNDCRIVPTTASADDYDLSAGWDISGFTDSVPRLAGDGDINGDGFDDVALTEDDNAYLIWGVETLPSSTLDVTDMDDEGVSIHPNGHTLDRVALIGDVNDDGFDDYALTVPNFDANRGRVYVIFGTRTKLP